MMTRAGFERLAASIAKTRAEVEPYLCAEAELDALDRATRRIAKALAEENPNFDRVRFVRATGAEPFRID